MTEISHLRHAIQARDTEAVAVLTSADTNFLKEVFQLPATDRDEIFAGVFPALATDEDRWEIIEAAAMDTVARPERGAFLSVVPYIPAEQLEDAARLIEQFRDMQVAERARKALARRTSTERE